MPKPPKGRAYLNTHGESRSVDRKVGREVSLQYYPTSVYGPSVETTFVCYQKKVDGPFHVRAIVNVLRADGTIWKLFDTDVPQTWDT